MTPRPVEQVRRDFTDDEKKRLHEAMHAKVGEIYALEAQKKETTTLLNASIQSAEKACADLHRKIGEGFEMVDVETLVLMNTPHVGVKRTIRVDTSETLREEPMSPMERQQNLDFELPPEEGLKGLE